MPLRAALALSSSLTRRKGNHTHRQLSSLLKMTSPHRSSDTSSLSRIDGDSFIQTPPKIHRFSSPPPGEIFPIGRTYYSPPPAPRFFAKSFRQCEPNADLVLHEINTGRSIINPTRMDMDSISLSRKVFCKEFEGQDEDKDLHRIISPSFPRWPPPPSPDGVGEEIDLDMPQMPSPIKLSMRTGTPTAQRAEITSKPSLSSRPSFIFHEHDFIPIRNDDDDDGKNEDPKKVD